MCAAVLSLPAMPTLFRKSHAIVAVGHFVRVSPRGSCLKNFTSSGVSWSAANSSCRSLGSHLVTSSQVCAHCFCNWRLIEWALGFYVHSPSDELGRLLVNRAQTVAVSVAGAADLLSTAFQVSGLGYIWIGARRDDNETNPPAWLWRWIDGTPAGNLNCGVYVGSRWCVWCSYVVHDMTWKAGCWLLCLVLALCCASSAQVL